MLENKESSGEQAEQKFDLDKWRMEQSNRRMKIWEAKGAIVANLSNYELSDAYDALRMSFEEDKHSKDSREEEIKKWYNDAITTILRKMNQLVSTLNYEAADKVVNSFDGEEAKKEKILNYKKGQKDMIYQAVITGLEQLRQEKDYKILDYLEERDNSKDQKLEADLADLNKSIQDALKGPEKED